MYSEQYFVKVIGQIPEINNERFFNYNMNKNLALYHYYQHFIIEVNKM